MAQLDQFPGVPESENTRELPFTDEVSRLAEILGPEMKPLPDELSEEDIRTLEEEIIEDHTVESFNELFRRNELLYRRAALQRLAEFEKQDEPSEESTQELIVANRAAVYHEYFQRTLNHTLSVMREYESLRAITPDVPDALKTDEQKAAVYIQELRKAVEDRVAFSNIMLIDGKLADGVKDPRLSALREKYMNSMSNATKAALLGDTSEKWKRGNALNQRIIDMLSGAANIQGVEQGFLPQRMYIALLKHRYEQLLEHQKELVSDPDMVRSRTRMHLLEQKHAQTEEGNGEFTKDDKEEYEMLRRKIEASNKGLDDLGAKRRETLQELLSLSDELGEYQLSQSELSTIQNQFGEHVDLSGATAPRADTTPEFVREAMADNVEERSNFHLERMGAMMNYMEDNVLESGLTEIVEDQWTKNGREIVRQLAHKISRVVTIPLPESAGIRDMAHDALTEPLDEAMGWPPGKENWEDLTPQEQEKVKERAKSILDAIHAFDRTTIARVRETTTVIQSMPDASVFVGEDINTIPVDRITPQNMQQLIAQYGGGSVYFKLFEQMEADWGSAEGKSGFMGQYSTFLESINTNLDVKIDVSKAMMEISAVYQGLSKKLLLAALAILGAGILTGALTARYLAKAAGGTLRLSGKMLRQTGRGIRFTAKQLWKLRNLRAPETLTKLRYLRQERAATEAIASTRVGKYIANLRVIRTLGLLKNSRIAQGAGRVARGLGPALIWGVAGYEMYMNGKRQDIVQDNPELQKEYASQNTISALEAAGYTASLALSFGPGILAAGTLYSAANTPRRRSEAKANWKRTVENWNAEFSPAMLKQRLIDIRPGTELETGDEALPTRVEDLFFRTLGYGKELDANQEKVVEEVSDANAAARGRVYEAYFTANTPESENAPRQVRNAVRYLYEFTHGDMTRQSAQTLSKADSYAELMRIHNDLQKQGKPTMLSYFNEDGKRVWLDLSKLPVGTGTREEKLDIVAQYHRGMRPMQTLIALNSLGETVKQYKNPETRKREEGEAKSLARKTLIRELLHDIHETERAITSIDWSGLEITGGEAESEMLVRWYVRTQIEKDIQAAVPKLLAGEMNLKQWNELHARLTSRMNRIVSMDINNEDSTKFLREATAYFRQFGGEENVEKAREYSKNALYELLTEQ